MHFNSADFCSGKILLVINMMDIIIFNNGKYTAEMSDNTGLSAIVNITSSDYMGTNIFFRPPLALGLTNGITLCLCSGFCMFYRPFIIIFRLQIFSKGYTAAS